MPIDADSSVIPIAKPNLHQCLSRSSEQRDKNLPVVATDEEVRLKQLAGIYEEIPIDTDPVSNWKPIGSPLLSNGVNFCMYEP